MKKHTCVTFGTMRGRLTLLAAVLTLSLAPATARADIVVTWMDLTDWALGKAWEGDRNCRKAVNTRASAQVDLAMFEAVNAIERRYTSYLGGITAPDGASAHAAAAQAAYTVLVALMPMQKTVFDQALTLSLSAVIVGDVDVPDPCWRPYAHRERSRGSDGTGGGAACAGHAHAPTDCASIVANPVTS